MTKARNIITVLIVFSMCISGCKNDQPEKPDGGVSVDLKDLKKDPNAYYDGCVSCTFVLEQKGRKIHVKATFKNETDYPIPVEKRHVFISRRGKPNEMEWAAFEVNKDGNEVRYRGISIDRDPSKFPQDFYVLPPHGTYTALINLSKHYDMSKSGKYTIKYFALNDVTSITKDVHFFEIVSAPIPYQKK